MASYLDQYTRFSQAQAELARSGSASFARGAAQAAAQAGAARRARANAERRMLESQAKEKKEVDTLLYGQAFSEMGDWMAADLEAERKYYDDQYEMGNADAVQMKANVANLKAGTKQYQNAWKQYEGDPDASPTSGSRYGMLNALEMMENDKNPWEDADQAPVDGYEDLVSQTSNMYSVLQRGKSEKEVYIGGGMDEATGKWMLTFGDPTDPMTWTKIDRGTLVANLEAGNAYAPKNGFKDINIPTIRELSSENQVKSFVGDDPEGPATYYRTMITGSGAAHKRFKKAIFDEMAPEFLSENELKEMRSLFVGEGLIAEGYGEVNKEEVPESEQINDNKIIPISFESTKAYEDIVLGGGGVASRGAPSRAVFEEIGPLTGLGKAIQMGETRDPLEGAARVFADGSPIDGRLIGKFVKYQTVMVPDPTISEETRRLLQASGQEAAGMVERKQPMPYYAILNEDEENAFYRSIGNSINAAAGEAEREGKRYIYNKYTNR